MGRREKCSQYKHVKRCCKGRPRCRYMRKLSTKHKVCNCGAYWFPHRVKSGLCGNPEAMQKLVWGAPPVETSQDDEIPF